MSLITRLTVPLDGESKIAAHQFMALVAEYQRGVFGVDKAFIASTFGITSPGELAELDDIITEVVNRRTNRDLLHDVLLVGEAGIYNTQKVENRIAQPNGDTDLEAITARQVYRIQNAAQTGEFAFRGCNVNAQGTPDLTVSVAAGSILSNGNSVSDVAAVASLAIPTPDAELPRVDLVYVDNTGTVHIRTGTPALEPAAPAVGMVNECALAFIFVGAGATAIQGKHIQDVTMRRNHGPLRIGSRNNPLTVSNSAAIQQLFGQSVPGQLLKGRMLRLTASGTVACAADMTIDWRVRFGGTIVWRDSTGSVVAGANPRTWRLVIDLFGQDDAVQVLGGYFAMGVNAAPDVGAGAINNDEIQSWSPIKGSSAIDSLLTRELNFATIMSVANAGNSVTIDYALAELV